jgi:acyl carrier protein
VSETRDQIRDFLVSDGGWSRPREELTDDLPLIENRVIDSMGLLRLVSWLEERYGVSIPDEEIVPSNFGTISGIDELLSAKRSAA